MKKPLILLIAVTAILMSACSSYNYSSVSTKPVSSAVFKTYAFMPEAKSSEKSFYNNDIANDKIVDASCAELNKRGFVMANASPDLLIKYTAGVDKKTEYYNEPVYYNQPLNLNPRFRYYRGRLGYYYNYNINYPIYVGNRERKMQIKEGSIVIDIIDRKTSKVIWRGWATGDLTSQQNAINDIPSVIEKYLKCCVNKLKRSSLTEKSLTG